MHVLFVTGEYPPMRGGVGAYTAELAQALVAAGTRVSVVTSRQAQMPTAQPAVAQPPSNQTGEISVYPTIIRWDWSIWRQIPRLAQAVGATWLHVQYQTAAFAMNPAINLAPAIWQWWARQRGHPVKVAWTYHDLLVPYLFPKAGTRLRRWVTEWPAHTSDLLIATNEGDYQQLATRITSPTLAKIPIGSNIHVDLLSTSAHAAQRAHYGYEAAHLLLGYFGFLNRSKGGITLVQTLHALVQQGYDAHLLMIGERVGASDPTNYAYWQEVEALIQKLQMTDRVQWTGHLADREVSHTLQLVDVLVMPYDDGASLRRGTLMAGLAHGCAVVTTTPQSPLPELVDGRDLLYVPPADPQTTAAAIARLVEDRPLWQRIKRGAAQQSQQFTWSAIAAQHCQRYTQETATRGASTL